VLLVVPHESADAVVARDTEVGKGVRQPRGSFGDLTERGPAAASVAGRDDRRVGEHCGAVPEDRRDGERAVLHGASHGDLHGGTN
jgi:hypothetical protein